MNENHTFFDSLVWRDSWKLFILTIINHNSTPALQSIVLDFFRVCLLYIYIWLWFIGIILFNIFGVSSSLYILVLIFRDKLYKIWIPKYFKIAKCKLALKSDSISQRHICQCVYNNKSPYTGRNISINCFFRKKNYTFSYIINIQL